MNKELTLKFFQTVTSLLQHNFEYVGFNIHYIALSFNDVRFYIYMDNFVTILLHDGSELCFENIDEFKNHLISNYNITI